MIYRDLFPTRLTFLFFRILALLSDVFWNKSSFNTFNYPKKLHCPLFYVSDWLHGKARDGFQDKFSVPRVKKK